MRKLVVVAVSLLLIGAGGATAVPPQTRADLDYFITELERIHPNPYHSVTRSQYRAAADRIVVRLPELDDDAFLVELMRLVAMLGEREGHTGLWALFDGHRRPMHLYPIYPYHFPEGLFVAAAVNRPDLVGSRLIAVQGRPVEELLPLVEPLATRDNALSLKARAPLLLVTSEILHGLGVVPTAGRATFTFELPSGERRDVALEPLGSTAYVRGLRSAFPRYVYGLPQRPRPLFVSRHARHQWVTTLDGGRVVYFLYNSVMLRTYGSADRITRLAKGRKVTRVIVDLRNNGGGEIGTYPPVLRALQSRWVNRPNRLVVLTSRETFSAATHFAADLERTTRAILVGEPSGGSPNHYSDAETVSLPVSGWVIGVPTIWYRKARPGDAGLVLEPDIRMELTARDFFAGNDPVLAAALALPR